MLRPDRFLTLALFGPLAGLANNKGLRIPILMYHSISNDNEPRIHPYYRIVTSPDIFAHHMKMLAEEGYRVIGLEEAIKYLRRDNVIYNNGLVKCAVITFDDGFLDFITDAFPVLAQYNFTATVFLPTSFINTTDRKIMGKSFLTWPQVRELSKSGITFGSHSVSHKLLVRMSRVEVEQELRQSKEIIEDKTGSSVKLFSYPFAFPEHNKDFVAFMHNALQSCGYSGAMTTKIGTVGLGDDPFSLKRIPVNTDDDLLLLRAKMRGGYNWMHTAQYAAKSVKSILGIRGKSIAKWSSE